MKFITVRVLCEGPTESNFVTQVLMPHFRSLHIYLRAEPLRKGHYGVVSWDKLRNAIKADIGRSKSNEYVTTMIDLYEIGKYPGVEMQSCDTPYERAKRIEDQMLEQLPNPQFIPYVQVHEFEALVLVDCSLLQSQFPDNDITHEYKKLIASIGNNEPEMVNDGIETAPSKRIIKIIPEYKNIKSTAGPAITAQIGISRLREKCPHFDDWITRLEALSK